MFSTNTRTLIKGYLEGFLQSLIEQYKLDRPRRSLSQLEREGAIKPFHEAILPEAIRRINDFERSFSTRLGTTFEATAYHIAQDVHVEADRGLKVQVDIPEMAVGQIEELIAENNRQGLPASFPKQVERVLSARSGSKTPRPAIADLYYQSKDGSKWFFEIKSPKPNKGQCLEVTQRLLTIQAMQGSSGEATFTYFGMPYNPYGSRSNYNWPYATRHLDMSNQVLLQEEFWTAVGDDPDTYEAVLEIYKEVGDEKSKDMIDQLAFGF